MLSLGEAGSVWRHEKLKEFEKKMQALGLEDTEEFVQLQQQIVKYTIELEELWKTVQEDESGNSQWWHDGEYDAVRADESNDAGLALCAQAKNATKEQVRNKTYGRAFECFTEAIRLHPKSPVYHCNRALVGLKLEQNETALEDAKHALAIDSRYVKAYIRAGKALLALRRPEEASKYFDEGLSCQAGEKDIVALKSGVEIAAGMMAEIKAANQIHYKRNLIPWEGDVDLESVSMELCSIEDVLQRNPHLASAMYIKVECLILLGRYIHALEYLKNRNVCVPYENYLKTEILWRQGHVEDALKVLSDTCLPSEDSSHLIQYRKRLSRYRDILMDIQNKIEDSCLTEAVSMCTKAIENTSATLSLGLYSRLLRLRANAHCHRRSWKEALDDLELCLSLNSEDVDALKDKADVLRAMSRYTEYFLCLKTLQQRAPGLTGISQMIEEAARITLANGRNDEFQSKDPSERVVTGPQSAFDILGVARKDATVTRVRKAYLKLAATWHPDKWTSKSEDEKSNAEERFKIIQRAYDDLCTDVTW